MAAIRGDRRGPGGAAYGLRQWDNADLVPRPDDVFQERLYCIRWRLPDLDDLLWAEQDERAGSPGARPVPEWVPLDQAIAALADLLDASDRLDLDELCARDWHAEDARLEALAERVPQALYRAVEPADLDREAEVLALLRERFDAWQAEGSIPSRRIVPGDETTRLMRERGWSHWHHLFTPRQLLIHGLVLAAAVAPGGAPAGSIANLLAAGRCTDWNSRLCRWWTDAGHEKVVQTFTNQALNTLTNCACRSLETLRDSFFLDSRRSAVTGASQVAVNEVRTLDTVCSVWITDPPYADAINYHELSEFFLAWYERHQPRLFPDWYADSKRALAIRGSGKEFRQGMVDAYRNLAAHMPDNGPQIVTSGVSQTSVPSTSPKSCSRCSPTGSWRGGDPSIRAIGPGLDWLKGIPPPSTSWAAPVGSGRRTAGR
jgi:hypothetical protein